MAIERPNQVWSGDIPYFPLSGGFLYLVALMDWYRRFVLASTLERSFCSAGHTAAFRYGQPGIRNSGQGSQFTAADFLVPRRALDNAFIERL